MFLKFINYIFIILFFSSLATANENNVLLFNSSPKKIEDLILKDTNNQEKNLSSFIDSNYIIVNFWATWCPPCIKEIPDLIDLELKFKEKFKVIFISVDSSPKETITKFLKKNSFRNFQTYIDEDLKVAKKLEVKVMPTSIIIDSKLNEVSRIKGYINWLDKKIINSLQNL